MRPWHPGKYRNLLLAVGIAQIVALVMLLRAGAPQPFDAIMNDAARMIEIGIAGALSLLVVVMIWRHLAQTHARDTLLARNNAAAQKAVMEREAEAQADEYARHRASARDAAAQARLVRVLSDGLSRLANGDLTTQIESPLHDPFPMEYEELVLSYNGALQQLDAVFQQINAASKGLADGCDDLDLSLRELSAHASAQAASLELTGQLLDQMTSSLQSTACIAETASTHEKTGLTVATTGAGARDHTIALMDAAAQISQLVSIIEDMAAQTHLLALKAGSDQGPAFVTSDLHALADRAIASAQAMKEQLSPNPRSNTPRADLVCAARITLTQSLDQARLSSEVANKLVVAAQEHAGTIEVITAKVANLHQTGQQNADRVARLTKLALTLKQQGSDLAATVQQFQLRCVTEAVQPKPMRLTSEPFTSARSAERMAIEQKLSERRENGQLWTST